MTMIDTSAPVLVLGSARHGALGIARSLGRLGVSLYIVDADPGTPSFYSRYCRGKFVWDFNAAPAAQSVKHLLDIGQGLGKRAVLIPTSDTAALFVASHAAELLGTFLFPDVSSKLVRSLYSKKQMYFLAKSLGLPTPETFFPQSRQAVLDFAQQARFPIILKAIEDHHLGISIARSKPIAQTQQQLLRHYDAMENPLHPNVMLQEYIPGGEDANWMFNGYFDENSDCLFGCTGRKIRQNPPYAGVTSLGVCLPNDAVAETAKTFMKAIGYRGILDVGYRYDARDGLHKVFDVNPRIGCTFRLFVLENGMDVARALYLHLTGQAFQAGAALHGRKWIVEDLDLASSFRYWRDGKITLQGWRRSMSGLQESALFAIDDPCPVVSMGIRRLGQALNLFRMRCARVTKIFAHGPSEMTAVHKYFHASAAYWEEIYARHDVNSVIHQERRALVLSLLEKLPVPPGSGVLEIGCGAGLISVALAQRGYAVKATDLVAPMVERTREAAEKAGVGQFIETRQCDIHQLPFVNDSFTLVMAIGVLPWLSSLNEPMREMVRVLRPDGYLIVTTDNYWRLIYVLHPFAWARLVGIRIPDRLRFWKRRNEPATTMYSVRDFDARLPRLGLEKVWGKTLGFGPFWMLNRLLPQAFEVKLHHGLQRLAEGGVPFLRSAGAQYITVSKKVCDSAWHRDESLSLPVPRAPHF